MKSRLNSVLRLITVALIFLTPFGAKAQWQVIKGTRKSPVFETQVMTRYVQLGKTRSLAAVIQNSKVHSKLYPHFQETNPDDLAKYLLKSFSRNFSKEKLESVNLYRAETPFDEIRLMIKKRKNDFLISFAFVKKTFLYRSYNETDFFQRLFIATQNQKAKEGKNASFYFFHLPVAPMFWVPTEAWAQGFSFDSSELLRSIDSLRGRVNLNSINNLVFAAQQIGPSINGVSASIDRASGGFQEGAKGIERSLDKMTDTVSDPKTMAKAGVGLGVGIGVGTMFSNAAAMVVNSAFTGVKNLFLDLLSLYRPGEKEQLLKEATQSWGEYEALQKEMFLYEKQIQDIEIALQMTSGKSVEEIFDVNGVKAVSSGLSGRTTAPACGTDEKLFNIDQVSQLKAISSAIQNDSNVKEHLCQKLNQTMDLVEGLANEMNITRALISKNMLVTYNNILENKQKSLEGPEVIDKAVKECRSLIEKRKSALEGRYKTWKCADQRGPEDCRDLKMILEQIPKRLKSCDQKSEEILSSYDSNYLNLAKSIEQMQTKMDQKMENFLRADCVAEDQKPFCNGEDGVIRQVKQAYNTKLEEMKKSYCPDLKADRFKLGRNVLAGNLKSQQDLNPVDMSSSPKSDRFQPQQDLRSPASVGEGSSGEGSNFIGRAWNSFWGGIQSVFKWFF